MTVRRVLVTGANKGIGLAIVEGVLAQAPDAFVLLGARSEARGDDAVSRLVDGHPSYAGRVERLTIDVASAESVAAAAASVEARFGRGGLYGVVNNAGIGLGDHSMADVLAVNTHGVHRVCEAFLPLIREDGRVVNVSSAAGPMYVSGCAPERQAAFTSPDSTWADIEGWLETCLRIEAGDGDFGAAGFTPSAGFGVAYGLSKAALNAYTVALARENPRMTINACTPGYIETDLTRPHAEAQGAAPSDLGMKPPEAGARSPLHLLLGEPGGSGWYFGSDAVRSPLDRYRGPGDPPYTGS